MAPQLKVLPGPSRTGGRQPEKEFKDDQADAVRVVFNS